MAKSFYNSLAKLLSEQPLPLNDVFYLITVFEHDVNSHIILTDPDKRNSAKAFIRNYIQIQDEFFSLLASSGEYSYDYIVSAFNSYGLITDSKEQNFSLSYLPQTKQTLLLKTINSTYAKAFTNLRSLGA